MKIGINLVGVSYNNAVEGGRLRDYENSIQNFYKNIVNPLREDGMMLSFTFSVIVMKNKIKSLRITHQQLNTLL